MKKILSVNFLCYAITISIIAQPTLPQYGAHDTNKHGLNDLAISNYDYPGRETFSCNPPFMVMGLYDPNIPLSPNTAIFSDPLVKAEIMSDGIQGKDKEYGDIDNDGLIDILYTKNDNELWYIPNTGSISIPDYQVINAVQTQFINVFSFRLVDWFNDGILDLLVLEDHGPAQINLYNDIHGQLGAPASIGLIDDTTFPLRFDQLIEVGDVDGDGDMDVLVSGQDPGLSGTAFLEQLQGAPPFFFPYLQLGANQTLPSNPMIPDNGGSYHAPELYDADCDGDLDLFISDPLLLTSGGHVDYYENSGLGAQFLYFDPQSVFPYGLVDIPGDDMRCDWVITRFADFFGDGCPEAIAYNPCNMSNDPNGEIFFYKDNCSCHVAFTYELNDSCRTVQFYNQSTGSGLTYFWDFGELPTSTLQNPIHQYTTCGTYNVCLTITGPNCNATVCQTLQLTDVIPPVALCKSGVIIGLDANCMAVLQTNDIDNGSFDNCFIQTLSVSQSMFNACGNYPVTLAATDWCGNTSTCNTIIQVVDNIPPAIIGPADMYLTTTASNCMQIVNGLQWLALGDNCGISSVVYTITGATTHNGIGDASGQNFNEGISTVTYLVTDQCGNTATCAFIVNLECICSCSNNLVLNPGFSNGAVQGSISGTGNGHSNNWSSVTHANIYNHAVCCDPYSVWLAGQNNALLQSIYQPNIPIIAGHHYKISVCAEAYHQDVFLTFAATNSPINSSFSPLTSSNVDLIGAAQVLFTPKGTYSLPIWTPSQNWDVLFIYVLSNQYGYAIIDNICLEEVFYTCCGNQQAFVENSNQALNTRADQETWEGVFESGNLMECNAVDFIDWGDGTIILGPLPDNTTLRHTYEEAGSYEVQYQVREFDPQDTSQLSCLSHVFIDTIDILPDSCFCGAFSSMYLRSVNAPPGMAVSCGEAPVQVNCPSSGESLQFTGIFKCGEEGICPDSSIVEWKLVRLPNDVVATGSMMASPFFGLSLLPGWYATPGTYEIQLTGACGINSCTCSIQFMVDCSTACSCDQQDFEEDLNRGFSTTLFDNNCEACFASILMTDCDVIEWSIDGVSHGSSIGGEMFFFAFSGDGTYAVTMTVTRFNADGSACDTGTVTQNVIIACGDPDNCRNSTIINPDFNLGAGAGGMNSGGASQGWAGISGEPFVIEAEPGGNDAWSIRLDGNFDSSSILTTVDPVCLKKTTGTASLRFKITQGGVIGMLVLKLYRLDAFDPGDCNPETCYAIEDHKATFDLHLNEWMNLTFPYDLSDWAVSDDCGDVPSVRVKPALYVLNHVSDDQNNIDSKMVIVVDNFCLGEMVVSLDDLQLAKSIHLSPNPTSGSFTLELPTRASDGMSVRITSLTGKSLLETALETGIDRQVLDTGNLPAGMYFVQLWSAGRLVGMEKLVKL